LSRSAWRPCRECIARIDESAVSSDRITTYPEFWRHYLREHAKPATRAWHYLGTSLTLVCLIAAALLHEPWFLLASVILGYAPAWIGHFTSEHNHPATFHYPLWSLLSDFRMFGTWLSGNLTRELVAAGASPSAQKQKAGT
jgi:hypothetical protein